LAVQRAVEPERGRWAVPGGHVEFGERLADAVARETWEECGIRVRTGPLLYVAEICRPEDDVHFVILDYAAWWVAGTPRAGSDVAACRWIGREEAQGLAWAAAMPQCLGAEAVRRHLGWG
jgi:8-oxo-dGTP diphosphatase